jgi:hypothetical protein
MAHVEGSVAADHFAAFSIAKFRRNRRDEETSVVRRKIKGARNGKMSPESADDYAVYLTASRTAGGQFFGTLEVVRKTDGKTIYPHDGALEIGPFATVEEARRSATNLGGMVIDADLKHPE